MTETAARTDADGQIRGRIEELMSAHDVPGASIGALAHDAEHYWASGDRGGRHPGPIRPDTPFRAASLSKTVVATALMRLSEVDEVDLDRPVRAYLPDFAVRDPAATSAVTLHHLVTHRAGWSPNLDERRPPNECDAGALARAVADLANADQISPPGRFYSYSNTGFTVAGRIIEVITGMSFEDAADELVFRPAGMTDTHYPTDAAPPSGLAAGHTGNPAAMFEPWSRSRARSPSGGLVTTAADLLLFARALLDTTVIGRHTVTEMWRPRAEAVGFAERIAVGWNVDHLCDGTEYVGHAGNSDGYLAVLSVVPARRFAVAVLLNSTSFPPLAGIAQDLVTQQFLGAARPEAASVPFLPKPDVLPYLGDYTDGLANATVADAPDGVLLSSAPGLPTAPVLFTGPDEGVAHVGGADLVVRFLRDAGAVRWLRVSGLVFRRKDTT
ncbi:serine hydrolase domain-containing protein [Kutzneria sp. NPDC052558]|uniref:serine hydrolase domain-containing protein n=1 Tax=Kutzneria sp. NPDC052558 TaxID=3364121 RepID=UPI0037C76005